MSRKPGVMLSLIALTVLTITTPASSQDAATPGFGRNGLSVRTGTGVMYGTSKERVLNGTFYVSELVWAVQPVFYVESILDLRAFGGLAFTLAVRNGVPGKSGSITDSDWLNYPANTDLTNFSTHDCYTERAFLMDARVGWEFTLGSSFSIEPFGAFALMSFKWTARDGYLQYPAGWFSSTPPSPPYPAWSPTLEKVYVYGTGIIYQQTFLIPAAGLRLAARFLGIMEAAVSFTASPLSFCFDLDNHVLRSADFYETMGGGILLEPGVTLRVRLSPRAALSLDASYRSITRLVGDTVMVITGVDYPGFPSSPTNPAPGTKYNYPNSGAAEYGVLNGALFFDLAL